MFNPLNNDETKKAIFLLTDKQLELMGNMPDNSRGTRDIIRNTYRHYNKGVMDMLVTEENSEVVKWLNRYRLSFEDFTFSLNYDDFISHHDRIKNIQSKLNGGN